MRGFAAGGDLCPLYIFFENRTTGECLAARGGFGTVMSDIFGMDVVLTYTHLLKKKFLKLANWAVFSGPWRLCRALWRLRAAGPHFLNNICLDPQGLFSNFQPIW